MASIRSFEKLLWVQAGPVSGQDWVNQHLSDNVFNLVGCFFCFGRQSCRYPASEERERRSAGAAILLWPVARWQAEPSYPLEISCGEKSLQSIEDPTLKQVTLREGNTETVLRWEDSACRREHTLWINLWRTASCERVATLPYVTTLRNFPPEGEAAAETT